MNVIGKDNESQKKHSKDVAAFESVMEPDWEFYFI